jgi:outer membrane autotransporter protein
MANLSGTLDNSGTISADIYAEAEASAPLGAAYATVYSAASAYGISMSDIEAGASLSNTGTVSAISASIDVNALANGSTAATAYAYGYYAYGINMSDLSGTLDNQGTISASINSTATATATNGGAYAYASAYSAYGISMGAISSLLVEPVELANSGDISATDAVIYTLDNSGTISGTGTATAKATGDTTASATAYADWVGGLWAGNVTGTLNNSGTISAAGTAEALATANDAYAYAYAYYVTALHVSDIDIEGSVTNASSGIIRAVAEATATARGTNSGSASATASATGVDADTISGTLVNSGTISAYASATATATGDAVITTASADAYGIYADNIGGVTNNAEGLNLLDALYSGNLVNTGSIIAEATASASSASAYAYGVYVSGALDGVVDNAGIIAGIADVPENGYSIYAESGSGTVNNYTGGLLSGNLYLGGTIALNNSGTVALPVMEGKMSAYVGGDYTQDEDGTLSFDADKISLTDPTIYGRLYVDGTAYFAPNTTLHVNLIRDNNIPVGTVTNPTVLEEVVSAYILEADTLTVTDNSALLAFSYEIQNDNTIDLTMHQVPATGMIADAGWGSAMGAAEALDYMLGLYGTEDEYEDMHGFLADLRFMEDPRDVARTIVTTLPSLRLELAQLTLENSHKNVDFTRERDEVARGMSSGSSVASNGNLWIGTFGSWADQSSADGAFGYDADTFGVMLGGDVAWGSKARIGLGLAFHKSDVDGETFAEQTADIKSFQPMLYGSYLMDDQINVKWHLGFGWHDNETTRFIPLYSVTANGDYDATSVNAGVAVSKPYKMDEQTTFTPSVRLDYAYIDNDSYQETGAGPLSLYVGGSNVDQLVLGLDGKIDHAINQDWNVAARLGIGYDMVADEDSLNAAYAGAPGVAFSTYGTEPSNWLYRGGLGLTYGQKDSLQVSLNYDLEGREDFTNQSVSLKLGLNF